MSVPLTIAVRAVCRHEWRLMVYTPLCYLFQVGFLIALAAAIFLVSDFYSTDEASPRLLTVFLPWVALILIPALSMRSWPDTQTDRSIELSMTLPVGPWALVLGKFLAGLGVLMVTLLFTLPFPITIAYLGEPDLGVVIAAYLAAGALMAFYYAASLFAAALAREPVGSFVLSLTFLFVLLLMGWDVFARLLTQVLPTSAIDTLSLYSPYHWVTEMSQGLITLGGAGFFIAATALALWGTVAVVSARRSGRLMATIGLRQLAYPAGGLILFALLMPVLAQNRLAFDMTEAGEFTLHGNTYKVMERLPEGTSVSFYWSADEASVPANIKSHARRVRAMLKGMAAASGGRLTVTEIDPKPDTDAELQALGHGLRRIPMTSGDTFFLGLAASDGQRVGSIPYMDIRRARLTEYDIALTLNNLTRKKTPKVGILSPLIPSGAAMNDRQGMSFINELKRSFDLAVIPFFKPELPDGLDTLLVIDASILRTDMLYAIDQFVMRGGSLIVMIDPQVRANRASNTVHPQPSDELNDISDLLRRYGLEYRGDTVVGDAGAASQVADRDGRSLAYPYWMRLRTNNLSQTHPATASLNEVFFVESGAFDILAADRVTSLISTGDKSGAIDRGQFAQNPPGVLASEFKPDGTPRTIAATILGPIPSAFGKPPTFEATKPALSDKAKPHIRQSSDEAAVFAIADVDWLFDPFSLQTTRVQGRTIVRPLNDNLALLQNLIEVAGGDRSLIAIRSRGRVARPFTRVEQLFKDSQEAYRTEEQDLAQRISKVEQMLAGIPEAAGVTTADQLPPEIRQELKKQEKGLLPLRRQLREIRRTIREGIDALGRKVTVVNLISGPVFVGFFWLLVSAWRRRAIKTN